MDKRSQHIGGGQLDAIRSQLITFADHTCIKLRFNPDMGIAGEVPTSMITKATFEVDQNGSSASKFLAMVKIYRRASTDDGTGVGAVAAADVHEFSYTGVEVNSGATLYTCLTLGDLVDKLNTVPGLEAFITDAPRSLTLDHATFFADDTAAVVPRSSYLDAVINDVSVSKDVYKRLGLPEAHNRDPLKLLDIAGTETGAVTLSVYTDDPETGAEDAIFSKLMTTTQTSYFGYDKTNAPTLRGPIILAFVSADQSALNVIATYQQAVNV